MTRATCPGCASTVCPTPSLECGGESDAVRLSDLERKMKALHVDLLERGKHMRSLPFADDIESREAGKASGFNIAANLLRVALKESGVNL